MTFMGFNVDRKTGNIVDPKTNVILDPAAMPEALQQALHRQKVKLDENFDALTRYVDHCYF